ncbi:piggyBac transposable element-derived protein 3-like [Colias croceus]|uniref:piggyBac transposable element-derived protein 3-like n=1 Tax=Colias crocea TaxID=72248 RepID=UPI001E27E2F8|nr:piggyBac transposable element-derived protein 3-like [Colias croceus]
MAWRSRKILSLIPPAESEESDIESDDDFEGHLQRHEYFHNDRKNSSSPRTISPELYDILADLSDCEDTNSQNYSYQENIVTVEESSQTARNESHSHQSRYSVPVACYIPETPSPIVAASPSSSFSRPVLPNITTRRTRQTTTIDFSPMPPPPTPMAKKRKMKQLDFIFKKRLYTGTVHTLDSPNFKERHDILSPQQYFQHFFTNELLDIIVDMTNLYSVQTTGKSICVTKKEMEILIGIEILMGIVDLPAVEDYWSTELKYEQISSAMSLKRYRTIKRYLHFCDNANVDKNDRYNKITPVMAYIRNQCLKIEEERSFAIDEMIIPYKGKKAGSRRQYMPKKPNKWGFKFLVRAGTSGMVYDFFAYDGANTFQGIQFSKWEEDYLGVGGKTVLRLCRTISNPILSTVYFDNWFTSLELIYYLRNEMGILSLGTLRKDRLRNCKLMSDKVMMKKGRGIFQVLCDNSKRIAITKWMDNKCIHIASSFCAQDPVSTIERYDKKLKKRVVVPCPNVIKVYNKHMGGVDIADMLTSLYRIRPMSSLQKW